MTERLSNEWSSSLATAINASQTSFALTSAPPAALSSGNWRIRVDNEYMLVTSVSGVTVTVTRGAESTTAVSHAILADVSHILTAGGLQQAILEGASGGKTTLVTGSGSNLTTTSATFVDLDATMNTSYVSSGGVLTAIVIATLTESATGGDWARLGVSINGTDFTGTSHSPSTANFRGSVMAIGRVSGLAAGTYTIKPRFHTSTATTTTTLSVGNERLMLILETAA